MSRSEPDLRLALPAIACWGTAGVLIGLPESAAGATVVLWLSAAVALGVAVLPGHGAHRVAQPTGRRDRHPPHARGLVTVCLAAAALAATMVTVTAPHRFPAVARDAADAHAVVDVLVSVGQTPIAASSFAGFTDRLRFRGTITVLGVQGSRDPPTAVSIPVVVYSDGLARADPPAGQGRLPVAWADRPAGEGRLPVAWADRPAGEGRLPGDGRLAIGSVLRLSGTLRQTVPGDSAAAQFFAESAPDVVESPPWWLGWAAALRSGFAEAASTLPGDGGDLLPGLAIGDTAAVGADLDGAMKQSSLSHLTAVSGANCAVVIAGVMLLGGCLRLRRGVRIAVSLAALGGFVVLVTPDPSVLRAAVMAVIVMLSFGAGRPGRGVPALALAVIVLLMTDPWLSRNYGFALSVLATTGLLMLAAPLGRVLARWMPTWLALVIAIPLAAQLACQPVLLLLSPSLPLYGVPANLLAGPAAPVATVVGLVGCLLLPWLPGVAAGCLQLAWLPSAWIAAVATACANLPGSRLPWAPGVAGVLGCVVLTVAGLVLLTRDRAGLGGTGRGRALARLASAVILIGFAGAYVGTLAGTGLGRAISFPADWQIAACDIGQGDAVVVRDGDLHALVDVGPDPKPLAACLHTLGITRINLLVLTHYDMDHIGGIDAVIGMVDTALVGRPENAQDQRLHDRLTAGGARIRQAYAGDTGTLGALRWSILWPVRGWTVMQVGNPGSVTIGFDGRGIRSLFLGDLGEDAQNAMLSVSKPLAVDVVKVAHHGSADQSARLYQRLRASAGLISVGADNGYGHPTRRLLGILAAAGTAALRTDRGGMLVVAPAKSGGGALVVWSEKAPP
jgi:competence protein ComEC